MKQVQRLTKLAVATSTRRTTDCTDLPVRHPTKQIKAVSEALQEPIIVHKQGAMNKAIEIARSGDLQKAVDKLKKNFFAASSVKSRSCKRKDITTLCLSITQGRAFVPLTSKLVQEVAASLKEAGFKSGAQYLVELKLLHIEAGFDLGDHLKRTFDLCRKALEREKGPTKRAAEVNLMNMDPSVMNVFKVKRSWPQRPGLAFVWAAIWMLREIELRNMLTSHVRLDQEQKSVSTWLPISKTDQTAGGIRRTLGCCKQRSCTKLCPWKLATKVLSAARKKVIFHALPLFTTDKAKPTTKTGFVNAWKDMFSSDVTGHSPRRSGAMYYVRNNVPIQELAFLGRWRSSVVLSYAEEALQEKPFTLNSDNNRVRDKTKVNLLETGENKQPPIQATAEQAEASTQPPLESIAQAFSKPKELWVVTKGRGSKQRPAHRVTKACWSLPIKEWATACGWLFAEKSAECSLLPKIKDDQVVCNKCRLGPDATSQGGSVKGIRPSKCRQEVRPMKGRSKQANLKKTQEGGRVACDSAKVVVEVTK